MEDSKDIKVDTKPVDESPSRSKDLSKTLPEEAVNHFLQGKRHMLVQDYTYAVQSLAKACEMYTEHFGELALECGEVYFLYGKALFRLSQQQAGVLGDALNEEAADDDEQEKSSEEESKENESEKDTDTENGEENPEEEADGGEESNDPSESTDSPQAVIEDTVKDSTEKEGEQNNPKPGVTLNETADESQQEPEEDDLELAWNSLETAKTIFLRQGTDNVEAQLKIADILQLLAEISMESDNNAAAIKDLEACLVIKERHLKEDDRLLAETYYQMGLAQMLEKMYKEALGNFMTTGDILKKKKDNLLNTPVPDDPGSFARLEVMKEVDDLNSVMDDIQEKIEDTKELILNANKEIHEALMKKEKEAEQEGFSKVEKPESTSKPVSNITHLLKRKKPEQDGAKENESKRVKLSSLQNGDTTVTE